MNIRFILVLISLLGIIPGLFLFSTGLYSISSDETSRTLISYYWFHYGKLESSSWLPLPFFLTGAGFALLNDMILVPRIISLLFGTLTIVSVTLIAHRLFRNKIITIIAACILIFIPQRTVLSIVPLPEIIFFTVISFAALFFLKWTDTDEAKWLIVSFVMTGVSASVRYEGWIFSAVAGIYILFTKIRPGLKTGLICILALFPLGWLIFNKVGSGSFLTFLDAPGVYYSQAQEHSFFNYIIFNPLLQFIEQNFITMNIIGIAGVIILRKDKRIMKLFMLFFIPLLLFSIVSLTGKSLPAHNFWRTSAVWVILLVPFSAYLIYRLKNIFNNTAVFIAVVVLFMLQLINANFYYIKNIKKEYCLTEEKVKTADLIIRFIDLNSVQDDRILIENIETFEHFDITLASQDPFRFIYSKRNSLEPYDKVRYRDAKINFYLVKSENLKKKLKKFSDAVLEKNGWALFKTSVMKADNREI